MAIPTSFKQQCPSCEAMVPIRDPKLIGRKIDCPKCKYRFIVEEPAEEEAEDIEEEAPAKKGKGGATAVTNKKPAGGKAPTKRRPDDDQDIEAKPKKKQGGSGMLVVGIALAAVAIIALAVGGYFLLSSDSSDEPSKPSRSGPSASPPPPSSGGRGEAKETKAPPKKEEGPKPRHEDITNLLPNDTQAVLNLPLEHLLGNAKINQAVLKTPGAFHEGAFQRIWGIAPNSIRRVILGSNIEKKSVFSVMRTSAPLKEKQIIEGLKLKAEEPINGLKYYLVKQPLDALSTFLLKGNVYHDQVALHFMDPFTVVCADVGPMKQFLQEKYQPKQLSKKPDEEEQQGSPPGGMPGGGFPGGMPGRGPGGTGSFQPPPGMATGMAPAGMTGSGGISDAAPVSSSYLTIDPQLKAVLDQVEKVDKTENQKVLLSAAVNVSAISVVSNGDLNRLVAFLNQLTSSQQAAASPLKFVAVLLKEQPRVAGLALLDFNESKVTGNAALAYKDAKIAQELEKESGEAIPAILAFLKLDFVSRNANRSNNMPGMPGMPGMPSGIRPPSGYGGSANMPPGGPGVRPPSPPGPMPSPGAYPGGRQPPSDSGEQPEEKGKLGNYGTWTKDNVLALGVTYIIPDDKFKATTERLERESISLRSIAAMSNRRAHIHELAAALQAYLEEKGSFPRGTMPPRSSGPQRLLGWRPDQRFSWMRSLLPYLAGGEFKDVKFDDDKPWYEGRNNLNAGMTVVPQFVAPSQSGQGLFFYVTYPIPTQGTRAWAATHFVGIAGVGLDAAEYRADDPAKAKLRGVFGYDRQTKKEDIKDGLDQTIAVIQVPPAPKAPWIAGGGGTVRGVSEDLECVLPFVCTEYQGKRGTFAIMADGKVRFIPATINPKTFQALCTIAGDDKVRNLDNIAPEVPPPEDFVQPELKAEEPATPPAPQEAGKSAAWTSHTPKGGGFTVNLPPGKVMQQDLQLDSPAGKLGVHIYGIELPQNAGAFMTIYNDYPDAIVQAGADKVLDGAKSGAVLFLKNAKITSESKIQVDGHPGREWIIDVPGQGQTKAHVFLVKNRLIQLIAVGEPGKVAEKDLQTFFDSFKLTGK